jgi:large subunit ribosomal protein L10
MVSESKKREIEEIKIIIEKYPVVGILDLYKMPSPQLQSIRKSLRGDVLIKMYKKSLISHVLKEVGSKRGIEKLEEFAPKEPALIFTEMNPFKLFKMLKKSKSKSYAKPNDVAQEDIVIRSGPTSLLAGPAIGELQRIKIPAMIKEGKIHVREDTVVAKKGEVISSLTANVLKKLDIQPMMIGINLLGVWENEIIFDQKVLDVDEEDYLNKIRDSYIYALNLCVNIEYTNKESIRILIQKAHVECKNLGINANILDRGILDDLVKKAETQAQNLKNVLKI